MASLLIENYSFIQNVSLELFLYSECFKEKLWVSKLKLIALYKFFTHNYIDIDAGWWKDVIILTFHKQ